MSCHTSYNTSWVPWKHLWAVTKVLTLHFACSDINALGEEGILVTSLWRSKSWLSVTLSQKRGWGILLEPGEGGHLTSPLSFCWHGWDEPVFLWCLAGVERLMLRSFGLAGYLFLVFCWERAAFSSVPVALWSDWQLQLYVWNKWRKWKPTVSFFGSWGLGLSSFSLLFRVSLCLFYTQCPGLSGVLNRRNREK